MSELRETRLEKANALREQGLEPYALHFEPTDRMARLQEVHADLPKGEERDLGVAVAGRVMTRRVMGKLAFFTLSDETGTIQLFLEKSSLGETFAQITALVDAGDLIGVRGNLGLVYCKSKMK